jgi:hypothetical protein
MAAARAPPPRGPAAAPHRARDVHEHGKPRDSRAGRCRLRTRSSRNADAPEIGCHQVAKTAREDRRLGRPMAIWVRICQVDRHQPFEADWLVVRRQQPRAFLRHPRAQPATTSAAESRETVIFRRFLKPALPEPTVARFAHAAERQLQAVTGTPRRGPRRQTGRRCPASASSQVRLAPGPTGGIGSLAAAAPSHDVLAGLPPCEIADRADQPRNGPQVNWGVDPIIGCP